MVSFSILWIGNRPFWEKKKKVPQFKCVACVSKTENKTGPHSEPIEPLRNIR